MFRMSSRLYSSSIMRTLGRRYASSKVIGIDLGTTNSAVAYIRDPLDLKSVTIIENDEGKRTTPSVVGFNTRDGSYIVGEAAKRQALINPENTFYATKRLIGHPFEDKNIQMDLKHLPFKVVENPTNKQAYLSTSTGEIKSPSEIGSAILTYLKKAAENYLNEEINKAVITVPAYFNDSQRQATKDAGTMAGLKVLRVVNEPTAAALSFGLNTEDYSGIIAVYDLGGGTFDISILDIEGGVFEVRATNGDTHLGGEDFDNVLVNYAVDKFIEANPEVGKETLLKNREVMQRIRAASEQAKIDLSHVNETRIEIPFIYNSKHIKLPIKERELDNMTMDLIKKTIPPVKKALKDAEIEPEEVNEVILVGGMTRMPKIRSVVSEAFGQEPNASVNPDETVALGAAIQGGVLSGEIKNVLLLDVTPLTLGIETYGGVFTPLITRNTTVPVKKTEVFSTGVDGQNGVDIRIYQGERGLVKDNKLIGDFKLAGIQPMPKGVPQIGVTFDIDADGIINVSASETSTGKENSIAVIANSGLTEEEISRMVDDANKNRELDNLIRQRVELITKADIMVSDTENAFDRFKDTIEKSALYPEVLSELQMVRGLIADFKANESDLSYDVNDVKKATDQVQKRSMQLFQDASKK
ncbi:LANO_0H17964g1_1 [Lachancea nothofagi CBS 11611]|uniref:Iron-sulfur cluster biogenesis chaperone, mitochondrial n=1 Tax=Lachancea nothofagi CBS 11611 TaxID=1266666 RepID=A0A1G4KMX7_9SACH|nr:LANO_0H17964g1_1 [Lachancea nothofagi CBS 11611]